MGKGDPSEMKHLSCSQHSASAFTYEREIKTSGAFLFVYSIHSVGLHLLIANSHSLHPTPPAPPCGNHRVTLSLCESVAVSRQAYLNVDAPPAAPCTTQWEWTSPSVQKVSGLHFSFSIFCSYNTFFSSLSRSFRGL